MCGFEAPSDDWPRSIRMTGARPAATSGGCCLDEIQNGEFAASMWSLRTSTANRENEAAYRGGCDPAAIWSGSSKGV